MNEENKRTIEILRASIEANETFSEAKAKYEAKYGSAAEAKAKAEAEAFDKLPPLEQMKALAKIENKRMNGKSSGSAWW